MFEFAQALRAFIRRHAVLIVLVVLALVFYAIGFKKGSMIAFALGFLFELGFWGRLLRADRRK